MELRGEYVIILVLTCILMFANGMANAFLSLYVRVEFASSLFLAGFVVTVFWAGRLSLELPSGIFAEIFSRFKLIFLGLSLGGISFLWLGFTPDIYQLLFARVLSAIGSVLFFCSTLVFIGELFPPEKRGKMLGLLQACEFVALSVGTIVGGYIINAFGFRASFILCGVLQLASILLVFKLRASPYSANKASAKRNSFSSFFSRKALTGTLAISSFSIFIAQLLESGIMNTIFPIYAVEDLGVNIINLTFVLFFKPIGLSIGTFFAGLLSDKYREKAKFINYPIAFGFGAISTICILGGELIRLFFGVLFGGLSFGLTLTTTATLSISMVPDGSRGFSTGFWRTFFDLGGAFMPIVATTMAESYGTVSLIQFSLILNLLCSSLFIFLLCKYAYKR